MDQMKTKPCSATTDSVMPKLSLSARRMKRGREPSVFLTNGSVMETLTVLMVLMRIQPHPTVLDQGKTVAPTSLNVPTEGALINIGNVTTTMIVEMGLMRGKSVASSTRHAHLKSLRVTMLSASTKVTNVMAKMTVVITAMRWDALPRMTLVAME